MFAAAPAVSLVCGNDEFGTSLVAGVVACIEMHDLDRAAPRAYCLSGGAQLAIIIVNMPIRVGTPRERRALLIIGLCGVLSAGSQRPRIAADRLLGEPNLLQVGLGSQHLSAQSPPNFVRCVPGMLHGSLRCYIVGPRLHQDPCMHRRWRRRDGWLLAGGGAAERP